MELNGFIILFIKKIDTYCKLVIISLIISIYLIHYPAIGGNLPELGGSEGNGLSLFDEHKLGKKIFTALKSSNNFLDAPEIEDYLTQIIRSFLDSTKISRDKDFNYLEKYNKVRLFLLINDSFNAFALPGNYIGVHTGLFGGVSTRGELLAVLSHELAHLTQRHISRKYGQRKEASGVMIASAILSAIAMAASEGDAALGIMSLGQTRALQKQLTFSRQAEREADRIGMGFLEAVGVDNHSMIRMLETLQERSLSGENSAISWLSTHPLTYERLADLRMRKNFDVYQDKKKNNFQMEDEIFEWLQLRLRSEVQLNSFFTQSIFSNDFSSKREKDLNSVYLSYKNLLRTIHKKNYKDAERIIKSLKDKYDLIRAYNRILYYLIVETEVELNLKQKYFQKALETIDLINGPAKTTFLYRTFTRHRIEALYGLKRVAELEQVAKKILKKAPDDTWVWKKRAASAFSAGKKAKAYLFLAEANISEGKLKQALERLNLIRSIQGEHHVFMAKVEVRIKQVQNQLK
ncbi:MAG: hypothetical protein CBC42_03470 [Betaproteobacteria bacterium TMED82]|nr:MAG: hypothetical protein CBC42_03470 [Betaproteobacteria bacterium TMED82]|tara:strand:- start:66755 stop:68314 length:1560 start_codon:yes stop_codon:yes gene_type:complete